MAVVIQEASKTPRPPPKKKIEAKFINSQSIWGTYGSQIQAKSKNSKHWS